MESPSYFESFFALIAEHWGKITSVVGAICSAIFTALLWLYRRASKQTGVSAWTWFKSFIHAPIAIMELQRQLTFANNVSLDQRFANIENDHAFFRQWLANETANRRMLLQNVRQSIMEFAATGECSWANADALNRCGITIGRILGRNWLNCVAVPDRERVREEWDASIEDGTDCRVKFRLFNSGSWVEFTAQCNKDALGQVVGYMAEIVETPDPRIHGTES